jgi:hypothetical protein
MSPEITSIAVPLEHSAEEGGTGPVTDTRPQQAVQRLNLVVSDRTYRELSELAHERHTSMKEVIRMAIGFIKIVLREDAAGNTVVVMNSKGHAVKELVLPS